MDANYENVFGELRNNVMRKILLLGIEGSPTYCATEKVSDWTNAELLTTLCQLAAHAQTVYDRETAYQAGLLPRQIAMYVEPMKVS